MAVALVLSRQIKRYSDPNATITGLGRLVRETEEWLVERHPRSILSMVWLRIIWRRLERLKRMMDCRQ
jgi:hypothetical protein